MSRVPEWGKNGVLDPLGPSGGAVHRHPDAAARDHELVVPGAADLHESLAGDRTGRPDPGPADDRVTEERRRFVVELVAGDDPRKPFEIGRCGGSLPVRARHLLYPAEVDHVVDVIEVVDVGWSDDQVELEQGVEGGRKGVEGGRRESKRVEVAGKFTPFPLTSS